MASLKIDTRWLKLKIGRESNVVNKGVAFNARAWEDIGFYGYANFLDISTSLDIVKAVNECPQVGSILYRKGQAHANGKLEFLQPNGIEPYVGKSLAQWERIFSKPNVFQNRAQYVDMRTKFLQSFGWCAEYKEVPMGFSFDVDSMVKVNRTLLNPAQCKIEWKPMSTIRVPDRTSFIKSFEYTDNGVTTKITDFENLYFYVNPNVFAKNQGYLPESPLKVAKYPINNSIKNYKSRARLISKPYGALTPTASNGVTPLVPTPTEKKEFLDEYQKSYGVEDSQSDIVLSPFDMKFTPFMYPIRDLQLLELLKSDSATICDVMGYEYDLLARDLGGVALNNKNEAGKNLYQNHIIPEAKNIDEQEMESLNMLANGIMIRTSFSHLPIMQEDKKLASDVLRSDVNAVLTAFMNNQCIYEDMVNRVGLSKPNSLFMGKYWSDLDDNSRKLFAGGVGSVMLTEQNNGTSNQNNNSGGN